MKPASRERSGLGGIAAVVGAGLVMVVCCAGLLLAAGGALGTAGGALANPWLITVGAVVVLAGTGYGLRSRGAGLEEFCTTVPAGPQPHEKVDPGGDVR
ncbi:mercury transporter [Streptomyces sp. HNM0663]|uniref:Mercury transporter n=1 Tax=Streptomyces chengmaiensis TaxID=3040919 RepID=A0ABT6HZ16_9ACTN|nr:mercury transporter [Streptomyces chengmaiensis]MDH2393951.1 mercury transporter [Streptomyces chengmaiensis]